MVENPGLERKPVLRQVRSQDVKGLESYRPALTERSNISIPTRLTPRPNLARFEDKGPGPDCFGFFIEVPAGSFHGPEIILCPNPNSAAI